MIGAVHDNFNPRLAVFGASWLDWGMEIQCYAQRLLNPYRGVVNVIKYQSAEAVTMDGVHWDIYVANEALSTGLKGKAQISDIRYGSWSEREGLKRGPIYPSDDFKRMEMRGHIVYEYLRQHHQDVPFEFADSFELWLLDAARKPIALIHSALTREEMATDVSRQWRAGYAAEEHFRSAAIGDPESSAAALGNHVNRHAASWQWIARDENGGGMGMVGGYGSEQGELFEPDAFPRFFLAGDTQDQEYSGLVKDYLTWQAPWLLLLDTLSDDARREMECLARARAVEMVKQHRLYPNVVDPSQIKAALVEMVLREKQPEVGNQADPRMSPFYMELNPAGGEYT